MPTILSTDSGGRGWRSPQAPPKTVLAPTHAPPKDYRLPKQTLDPRTQKIKTAIARKTLKQMIPKS